MSELVCLNCGHGPHTERSCMLCSCETWMRADLISYRSSVQINNILAQEIPALRSILGDILCILVEAYPVQVQSIDAKRKQMKEMQDANAVPTPTVGDTGDNSLVGPTEPGSDLEDHSGGGSEGAV